MFFETQCMYYIVNRKTGQACSCAVKSPQYDVIGTLVPHFRLRVLHRFRFHILLLLQVAGLFLSYNRARKPVRYSY